MVDRRRRRSELDMLRDADADADGDDDDKDAAAAAAAAGSAGEEDGRRKRTRAGARQVQQQQQQEEEEVVQEDRGNDDAIAPARGGRSGSRGRSGRGRGSSRRSSAPRMSRREVMENVARSRAEHFARFEDEDEVEDEEDQVEEEEEQQQEEDGDGGDGDQYEWFGPFSTARRLIKDREAVKKKRSDRKNKAEDAEVDRAIIEWAPSEENVLAGSRRELAGPLQRLPSLFQLSLQVLCEYAECIESLVGVPDAVRRELAEALASRRKLSTDIFRCLAGGATSELVTADCSHVDEADMEAILLEEVDVSILESLELGQCGRSWTDKVALAFTSGVPSAAGASPQQGSSSSDSPRLERLVVLKIGGAYRLSDQGLKTLVQAAPFLGELSLTHVSRLTSHGLSECLLLLSQTLHTLVLDGCVDLTDSLLTEAFKALPHLEHLSLRELPKLSQSLVLQVVQSKGQQLKSLLLGGSTAALTDKSVSAIAQSCASIRCLDLDLGTEITSKSFAQLTGNCRKIQELSLKRCNRLSTDSLSGIARSLPDLAQLSLNNVANVRDSVLLALVAGCKKALAELDLSFCRSISDKALGYMADNLSTLRALKLYGCSQVTRTFLHGHRNPDLLIHL